MITSWRLTKANPHPAGKRSTAPLREQEAEIQRQLNNGICDDGQQCVNLLRSIYKLRFLKLRTTLWQTIIQFEIL